MSHRLENSRIRTTTRAGSVLLVALVAGIGCAAQPSASSEQGTFDVRPNVSGKADDTAGHLSAEGLARLESAFDRILRAGNEVVQRLEREIARLEQENRQKRQQVDALVAQIESREDELRRRHRRNLVLCAFLANPSTCVLANVLSNDDRLKRLRRDLDAARQEQTRVHASVEEYEARRDRLRQNLVPIRESKERLVQAYRSLAAAPTPEVLVPYPELGAAYLQIDMTERLDQITREEIGVLVRIRDAALELSDVIDDALETLDDLDTSTRRALEAADQAFFDLFKAIMTGDGEALVERWLDRAVRSRTKRMLAGLGWPAAYLAEKILAGESLEEGQLHDRWYQRLVRELDPTAELLQCPSDRALVSLAQGDASQIGELFDPDSASSLACADSVSAARLGLVCAYSGDDLGWRMFRVESGEPLLGPARTVVADQQVAGFNVLATCVDALDSATATPGVPEGVVCNWSGSRDRGHVPYYVKNGEPVHGRIGYDRLAGCTEAIDHIRHSVMCVWNGTGVDAVFLDSGTVMQSFGEDEHECYAALDALSSRHP